MGSLPWPAEAFLSDASVKLALAHQKHSEIAFLIVFASQAWLDDRGMLPADENRLAAILGLEVLAVRQAVAFWREEGKLAQVDDRLYLQWLTRAKATREAASEQRSEQARHAAQARWSASTPSKGENLVLLPASGEHTNSNEWPKEYTKVACDVWIARWGAGSAPGDVIAASLRALKKGGAPWDAVLRSWERYVDTVEAQYASPVGWRKRWRSYDPEEPEFDHEAAKVADSMDRQARTSRRKGGFKRLLEE